MTILEKMKEEYSPTIEHVLNDKYYLFIEGLDEDGESTCNVNKVVDVIVEVHKRISEIESDFIDTLDNLCEITIDTKLDSLTFEYIQKKCGGRIIWEHVTQLIAN